LNACRLKQIRRLLLRAIRWHAANYAATDTTRQVGQQPSNKKIRWLQIMLSLTLREKLARLTLLATASGESGPSARALAAAVIVEA
jgi:hypothetical protein